MWFACISLFCFLKVWRVAIFILGDAQFVGCSSIWVVLLLSCCFFGGLMSIKEEFETE
jgi:hypothetical protein